MPECRYCGVFVAKARGGVRLCDRCRVRRRACRTCNHVFLPRRREGECADCEAAPQGGYSAAHVRLPPEELARQESRVLALIERAAKGLPLFAARKGAS